MDDPNAGRKEVEVDQKNKESHRNFKKNNVQCPKFKKGKTKQHQDRKI